MATAADVKRELRKHADAEKAQLLARFFKTGKGEYGEGDIFLGIVVPHQRAVAKRFKELPLGEVRTLLRSPVHEYRLTALLILTYQFPHADEEGKRRIYEFYLQSTRYVNNWDLIDLSAPNIVGAYLRDKPRLVLRRLARSTSLWERRIAVLATFVFIKQGDVTEAFRIAELLLSDKHDLIHKAVGWMLREIGKRDEKALQDFLRRHAAQMPRTMLRYAVERFPEQQRRHYLKL
jgi:3-methyladenine DNA glycosylase AlkD